MYMYILIHLFGYHATKLEGSVMASAYSVSLRLRLGARIQGWMTKFTSFQPLGNKQSLILVFGRLLGCTLEDVYKIL
jgi:hypothetical protein